MPDLLVKKKSFVARVAEAVTERSFVTTNSEQDDGLWVVFPFAVVMTFVLFIFAAADLVQAEYPTAAVDLSFFAFGLGFIGKVTCSAAVTKRACEIFIVIFASYFLLHDWRAAGKTETWTGLLTIHTILLICNCRRTLTTSVLIVSLLYLVLKCSEEAHSWGLYSPWPEDTTSGAPVAVRVLLIRTLGIGGGYLMSRRLVEGVGAAGRGVEEMKELLEEVACAMVDFDVDGAERVVRVRGQTPLTPGLVKLLGNLKKYRPYVPEGVGYYNQAPDDQAQHIFETISCSSESSFTPPLPPPGQHTSIATLVFTDIQSSTAIWEAAQAGMAAGLKTHNQIMRQTIGMFQGYEVKTIGDAFMVAFDNALDACRFCLKSQELLFTSEWPESLLALPECAEASNSWRGLRVRMGVHCGEVEVEENPVTGRFDYFGPTVNLAARVESAAVGGAVGVTESVMGEVSGLLSREAKVFTVGSIPLKGVPEKTQLSLLIPMSIDRLRDVIQAAQAKHFPNPLDPAPTPLLTPQPPTFCFTAANRSTLRSTTASIMSIKISNSPLDTYPNPAPDLNNIVVIVVDCLERCEGAVENVFSSSVHGTWNCSKKLQQGHLSHAVRAVGLLCNALSSYGARDVHCGLATGTVLHGNVGTSHQKFLTVAGGCVELSSKLAGEAKRNATFALHGAMPGHTSAISDPSLKYVIRPIDRWVLDTPGVLQLVTVYELRAMALSEFAIDVGDEKGWAPKYTDAFESGDYAYCKRYLPTAARAILSQAPPVSPGFCIDYATDVASLPVTIPP